MHGVEQAQPHVHHNWLGRVIVTNKALKFCCSSLSFLDLTISNFQLLLTFEIPSYRLIYKLQTMADPLSIVASVIAIAQLTERLIALGYVYLGGTKAASKDLRELVNELQSLGKVLVVLQDYAQADQNLQSTALQSLNGQNGPLPGCALELRRLQLKLEPKQGLRGMIQSLKWPFKEQETQQHIARIQRQKSLFILALTVDHM